MRVLTVIDSLDASGGAERSLASMAPALRSLGIDLHVAYLRERPRTVEERLRAAGVTVHSLSGARNRVAAAKNVASLTRRLRPELVHTTLFEADQAGRVGARIARCRVVTSLVNDAYGPHHYATPGLPTWKLHAARVTDALTARAAVRFHAITSYVADVMATRLRIPRDRFDVVPRGRDPVALGARSTDRRDRARRSLGVADDQPLVVAVGRQEWQKGHDTLLDATATLVPQFPRLAVVIAGRPGQQSDALQGIVTRTGLESNVRILGFRDDVAELLCAADVFAFPSRWEGLGSTLVEAMALEAPIVASDLPAVREVVTAREARLVPASDPRALAASIEEVLRDRDGARDRAITARERFLTEFTIERTAKGMLAFYERALS